MIQKISQLKPNPDNPRFIKDDKFKKLVQSIKDFPEMLKLRPIVINLDKMVLGGNMRLKAAIDAGLKEVPVVIADLSKEQEKEFIIKDNLGFGQWDWDIIANEWDTDKLSEWGLDVINMEEFYGEETFDENKDTTEDDNVLINLTMPYDQYELMQDDFQKFIKKYPKIVCKVQN
jgi:ParB-like chromosome segregation protein Spo0J